MDARRLAATTPVAAVAALFWACAAATSPPLSRDHLTAGAIVRVRTTEFRPNQFRDPTLAEGTMDSLTGSGLWIRPTRVWPADRLAPGQPQMLMLDSIQGVELRSGHRRATAAGAVAGALVGLVVGFVGAANVEECSSDQICFDDMERFSYIILMPALGALVGFGVGALIKTPRWRPVMLQGR